MKKEPKFLQTPLTKLQSKVSDFFRKIDLDQAVIFIVVVICEIIIWL
jgi:hypothetical protein